MNNNFKRLLSVVALFSLISCGSNIVISSETNNINSESKQSDINSIQVSETSKQDSSVVVLPSSGPQISEPSSEPIKSSSSQQSSSIIVPSSAPISVPSSEPIVPSSQQTTPSSNPITSSNNEPVSSNPITSSIIAPSSNEISNPPSSSEVIISSNPISSSLEPVSSNPISSSLIEGTYYHVVFKNYDESILEEIDVLEGTEAVYSGETPIKEEDDEFTYEFDGWDVDLTNIQSDMTAVAQYKAVAKENWGPIIWF